jgi:hypothetical protein
MTEILIAFIKNAAFLSMGSRDVLHPLGLEDFAVPRGAAVYQKLLGRNLYGHQLWDAAGVLDGFGGVFGREFSHQQSLLTVGRHLDRSPVNTLHVFGNSATTVHFHNKFGVLHGAPYCLFEITIGRLNRAPPFLLPTIHDRKRTDFAAACDCPWLQGCPPFIYLENAIPLLKGKLREKYFS